MPYDHTQRGLLHWLLGGIAVLFWCLSVPAAADEAVAGVILRVVGAVLALLAPCFARLRVHDDGEALRVAFGPWGLFATRVRYADIEDVAAGRSALIDGWGIHWIPRRGWTWNVHGFDAVELTLTGGRRMRIGTDDPEGLAAFLESRVPG